MQHNYDTGWTHKDKYNCWIRTLFNRSKQKKKKTQPWPLIVFY